MNSPAPTNRVRRLDWLIDWVLGEYWREKYPVGQCPTPISPSTGNHHQPLDVVFHPRATKTPKPVAAAGVFVCVLARCGTARRAFSVNSTECYEAYGKLTSLLTVLGRLRFSNIIGIDPVAMIVFNSIGFGRLTEDCCRTVWYEFCRQVPFVWPFFKMWYTWPSLIAMCQFYFSDRNNKYKSAKTNTKSSSQLA